MLAVALLRAASLLLSLQAAGVALFTALFTGMLVQSRAALRRGALRLTGAAVLVSLVCLAAEPVRLAGDLNGMTDPALYRMVLHSTLGVSYGLRLLALLFAGMALWLSSDAASAVRPIPKVAACLAVSVTLGAFTLTGHTVDVGYRALAAGLLAVHLLIVMFWLGSLWPLLCVTRCEQAAAVQRIISRFSSLASWSVPVIGLAGLALATLLLPDWAALARPYGLLLLNKLALFLLLLLCATANKWRLGPAAVQGGSAAIAFRRMVMLEYALIALVLVATALMTTFYSPAPA
jgi:putative copper resistance protein D